MLRSKYLFVFFHSGIELLGEVIGHIRHPRLLLIGTAQAALVLTRLFIVFLLCIFAIPFCVLFKIKWGETQKIASLRTNMSI